MGSKTSPEQGVTFLLLLKKTLLCPGICLVVKHLPLPRPQLLPPSCANGTGCNWVWKQLGKHVPSAAIELGEVNTDVFSLHGDKSILLLSLTFPVKHKGMESWLEYSLCLNVSPFPSGTKSTPLPDTIFPSIREIFKDPLNWKSSGSRRGHRHLSWGSLTQRGKGCPLTGLLIISAVHCGCEITLTPPDLSLHTLRTHHHRNKSLLMWCAKEMELWELHTRILSSHQCLSWTDSALLFCLSKAGSSMKSRSVTMQICWPKHRLLFRSCGKLGVRE